MPAAKKQLAVALADKNRSFYQNKCVALDQRNDELVYWLYDLNVDEVSPTNHKGV